jgi:shikimate kinase
MKKSNIVLIGMPGAGKSTVGIVLAKTLGMHFVDTDILIQEREGRFLQDIINIDGLERFMHIEEQAVLSLQAKDSVIATGGSVIYSERAVTHLKADGVFVYLKHRLGKIEQRVNNIQTRGLAMKSGQTLASLYRERTPLYEKYADITIDCSRKHMEKIILEIKEKYFHFFE